MAIKRLREEEETNATMADRLTALPESLQLHILSSLETKYVFHLSIQSKSWASILTSIPILNFNSYSFKNLPDFDRFVGKILSLRRQPVKLDKLTFRRGGTCSDKMLKKVFDYTYSQGVRELEVITHCSREMNHWPIQPSDSLTSLKLSSNFAKFCSFMGQRLGAFKNLTNLHLKWIVIEIPDPFSGFHALQKLTLVECSSNAYRNGLYIHALQLSELTMTSNHYRYCVLTTPKLRHYEYQGSYFLQVKTLKCDLSVLDTVIMGYNGFCCHKPEKKMFDDLLKLFSFFRNAKSLKVFSSVVHLLSLFPSELANAHSPFWDLKCLKVDLGFFFTEHLLEGPMMTMCETSLKRLPQVKAYLLQNSPDAECTMIYPTLAKGAF